MKTIGMWFAVAAIVLGTLPVRAEQPASLQAVTLDIQGMKAGSAAQVEQILSQDGKCIVCDVPLKPSATS